MDLNAALGKNKTKPLTFGLVCRATKGLVVASPSKVDTIDDAPRNIPPPAFFRQLYSEARAGAGAAVEGERERGRGEGREKNEATRHDQEKPQSRRKSSTPSSPSDPPSNLLQQYHICSALRVASRLCIDGKGLEQVWRDSFSEAVALRRMGHLKMADAELTTTAALLVQSFEAMAAEAALWFSGPSKESLLINDFSRENAICSRVKDAIARALRILRPPEQKNEDASARRWERSNDRVRIATHVSEDQARHFPTLSGADPKNLKSEAAAITNLPGADQPAREARSSEVELAESLWQLEPIVCHPNSTRSNRSLGSWASLSRPHEISAPTQLREVGVLSADAPGGVGIRT